MAEDRPEEIDPSPDTVRAKRAPPTIDLEATEISGETRIPDADASAAADPEASAGAELGPSVQRRPMMSSVVTSAVSGACAAALVIAVAWLMGWPGQEAPPPAPPVNSTAIDDLAARIASVESKAGKPTVPAPDPAAVARVDALEKSVAALRSDLKNPELLELAF